MVSRELRPIRQEIGSHPQDAMGAGCAEAGQDLLLTDATAAPVRGHAPGTAAGRIPEVEST